ncbi:MAG: fatty acid desaturase [Anaerolineae bacterium]|nr:fatty acid desaturase [Anaerolineae bacterium]
MLLNKFAKRDYSLVGKAQNAVALNDDLIEERVEGTWWSPDIPRKELKALMVRSDGPALFHFGLWILLLIASGWLAVLSWGTWWAIPAFLTFGTIYSSADARWHECGHGTPFKTRWLNEFFYHVSSFMTLREAHLWRWSHARHHTDTIIVMQDPEIQVMRPADLLKIMGDFFWLYSGPSEVLRIVRHALGRPDANVRTYVPETVRQKMYWSSRIYVAIFIAFGIWSYAIGSFLPLMFIGLPRFYGGWLHQLLGLTQHAGLAENTRDHRQNTRTVYINPVFQYLYMNMNYHIEHHVIPMVPFHALPKLHQAIMAQTPPPYTSLWQVYKEMIPALIKQAYENPDHHIVRPLPAPVVTELPLQERVNGQNGHQTLAEKPQTSAGTWVEVCAVDDLDEEEVIGFDHNGKKYAVYRLQGDNFYASDGLCTHEKVLLANGLVLDGCIECPMHNGRFDVATGKAVKPPVHEDLKTYPAARRGDKVFINLPE